MSTFDDWWDTVVATKDTWVEALCREAWEVAFDEGVKWTLKQDANTLNKLQLTLEDGEGVCTCYTDEAITCILHPARVE